MEFGVLGLVEVTAPGGPVDPGPPKQRTVLAALLLHAGRPVTVTRLTDCVWGVDPPSRPSTVLSTYLSQLRRALRGAGASGLICRHGDAYLLSVDPSSVDVHRFRGLAAQAGRVAGVDPAGAATLLERAQRLWRGEALAGLPGEWAARQRVLLDMEHHAVRLSWAVLMIEQGRPHQAVPVLRELADLTPLDEAVVEQLMVALFRTGQVSQAVHRYRVLRVALRAELGVEPSPALQALLRELLRNDRRGPALRRHAAGWPIGSR